MAEPITRYTEERHEFGSDRPEPVPGVMQVIYKNGAVYAVDFVCPCGCGHTCFTPVTHSGIPRQRPQWDYTPGPTLSPSVRFLGGCKAHFNITNGAVIIHGDSGK